MTEAWRCRKFEFGLKQELKEVVIPMTIRDFLALVESLKSSSRLAKPEVGGPTSQLLQIYGHATKDCRARLLVPNITGVQQNNNHKARVTGRVFAISGAKASQSDSLVRGICSIIGTQLSILFDSGATHSFISFDCAKKLKLLVRELEIELVVSTPTKGIIVTSSMCAECPVIIDGQRYKINMICIPLKDLEVILGMNWFSVNHILIDCGRKKLIFPGLERMQIISTHQFKREIQEGAKCFMLLACSIVIDKVQKDMFVVQEFMDVFPDEIPELPPKREIEFAIDLIPGAGPVSISPYRMAPVELAELKEQLEDLLEKQFI
ncbi:uncharacterized protein [Phaseolus vulgaris]|uniref:uncharacterized protein n=1 Tax=Phaseolus vulgaris TaxID=3885 RepID=UPI0035CC15EF